jgi:hypothetical protein
MPGYSNHVHADNQKARLRPETRLPESFCLTRLIFLRSAI